jgi:chromosome segregation ATPase
MHRSIAPLSVLLLSCAIPFAASAATPTRELCRLAETDLAAFLQLPDFADNILRMSERCPKIALNVTNMATGTIATAPKDGGNDKANPGQQGPDYSDLLNRLKVATKNLNTATTNVEKAQANLDRTLRHAKKEGLSEEELQALYALNGDEDDHRVLPDYTAGKRQALADYIAARDRLSAAEEKLDEANDRAQPLVQKALELAGKASVAEEDLAKALDGLSPEERQALLDKTLADAKQSLADLETRIATNSADFEQATKALKSVLNDKFFKRALSEFEEEHVDYAKAEKHYQDRLARDPSCQSKDCSTAERKLEDAAKDLNKARKVFDFISKALQFDSVKLAYNQSAEALAASQAAKALAEEAAAEAARQAKELSDLLSAAADALTQAEAASEEARAATAAEEAEVAAARAALEVALAKAQAALEGSAEEEAALEEVLAAQDALRAALDSLGAAQDVAEDLTEEVAEIKNAPEKVSDVAEDLETASENSDAVEEDAIEDLNEASEAVDDYHDAQSDLSDALEGDKATEETSTEEKSEPNT